MFIVESYAASDVVLEQQDRAARAAQAGSGIRYIRTTIVPGDQSVLHLFEATSTDALREAVRIAQRVVLLSSRPGTVVGEWAVDDDRERLHDEITGRLRQVIASHAA